ncbi:MAG TPA: membrane dipeptidase [Steroidobacter sp.]
MKALASTRVKDLMQRTVVWDNHACMPLRPDDETFLVQLARHRNAGVNLVSLNVYYDGCPPETAFLMLASLRHWIARHPGQYVLAQSVTDIESAKREGKLAVMFDIEGGRAVEAHPGLVEVFYRLGVRWMLLAYNKNNRLGGGCQDEDQGLTDYGRLIIDEMQRVGMVLCCSHVGYRTAREAIEYSKNPVIFSHSNARAVRDHERNIPDDLMRACARTGGVVNFNGIGIFLGDNDNSTEALIRHIDYAVELIGPEHVGLGLDYVFDAEELNQYVRAHPDIFPPEKGYRAGIAMIEPERIPIIAEELLKRGYSDEHVQGILGHNNLRVARQVWR